MKATSTTPSTLARPRARKVLTPLTPATLNVAAGSAAALSPPAAPSQGSFFDCRVMTAVPNADEDSSSTTWYSIKITCRLRPDLTSWRVTRRYSEFDALASHLANARPLPLPKEDLPPLPPKIPSLLLSAAQRQRRVVGLHKWCLQILSHAPLLANERVAEFFDLSFGVWHMRDASLAPPPPLLLDAALHASATIVQAHSRRHCARCRLRRAIAAAMCVQRFARSRRGGHSSSNPPLSSVINKFFDVVADDRAGVYYL